MLKLTPILKNEDGYLTILGSLLILGLLTVISISGSKMARTEVSIAKNEIIYQRNFYLAEGATTEAIDYLENSNDPSSLPWVETDINALGDNNYMAYILDTDEAIDVEAEETSNLNFAGQIMFLAGVAGIPPGFSLDMSRPVLYDYSIFGRCEWDGASTINIGYRKAQARR